MPILSFFWPAPKHRPGIYCITNRRTGWFYIGATTLTITKRWDRHRYMLDTGRHHNKRLQADWDTYGERAFKFTVIEVVRDASQIFIREHYWQRRKYNSKCYNPNPDAILPAFVRRRISSKISRSDQLFIFRVMRGSLPKTKKNIRTAMELMGITASEEDWKWVEQETERQIADGTFQLYHKNWKGPRE
jgi:group I intron endonuclease